VGAGEQLPLGRAYKASIRVKVATIGHLERFESGRMAVYESTLKALLNSVLAV
jgi:hypothetical protein